MTNEILKELIFSPEKGGLFYRDVRYLLVRPETLVAFQKGSERELGEKASQILFQSGFQGGTLSAKRFRQVFGFSDEEIIHFMIEMGTQIGWGRFEVEKFDPVEKQLMITVYHSPFAEAYGSSSLPVCHFIRGVLSGMFSMILGEEIEGKELSCLAMGDHYCRFKLM